MKKYLTLILGLLISLGVIAGGYFLAMGIIGSLYSFRSPLKDSPPKTLQPLGDPLTGRLVFVLVDGLRADTALDGDMMPNLAELRSQGASATIHSQPPSYSEPAYTVLLSGARGDFSDGPVVNLDYEEINTLTQDDLFSAADRAGLKTAISGYYWFEKLVPQSAVDLSFYTPGEDRQADEDVMAAALPWLENGDAQLVLIHLDQVDYAGHHEGGARDPRWNEAAARVDQMIGQISAKLDLSRDTILVLSDHGHIWNGGHGGQDDAVLSQPFVLAGKGVTPGEYGVIRQVDIAPTLAALLGAAIPSSSVGQPRTEMLILPAQAMETLPGYLSNQLTALVDAYSRAVLGESIALRQDLLDSQTAQSWIDSLRMQRLAPERTQRGILSIVLLLVPLGLIIWKWRKVYLFYLGGGLFTLFLFNLRYAWIDGRTFSLSSVSGEMDMILYTGVTALLAFLISWLVVMFSTKAFQQGGLQAATSSILFTLFTLYLLSIGILLHFSINGWFVAWTLPDFLFQFLGLIALIIAIFTALGGILLTGVAALACWLSARKA